MTKAPVSGTSAHSHVQFGLFHTLWRAIMSPFSAKHRLGENQVVCISMHRSFNLWLLILIGWVCSEAIKWMPDHAFGWTVVYLWVLLYTIAMLIFDVSFGKLLITTLVVLLLWISAKYAEAVEHIAIIGPIVTHFKKLDPTMSFGFGAIVSWVLFVPWFIMVIESFRSGRIFFQSTTITEIHLVTGNHDIDRSGLNFRCTYPNLLEFILGFGAGELIASDSNGVQKHAWPHIVGLYFKWNRLDSVIRNRVTEVGTLETPEDNAVMAPKIQDAVVPPGSNH